MESAIKTYLIYYFPPCMRRYSSSGCYPNICQICPRCRVNHRCIYLYIIILDVSGKFFVHSRTWLSSRAKFFWHKVPVLKVLLRKWVWWKFEHQWFTQSRSKQRVMDIQNGRGRKKILGNVILSLIYSCRIGMVFNIMQQYSPYIGESGIVSWLESKFQNEIISWDGLLGSGNDQKDLF